MREFEISRRENLQKAESVYGSIERSNAAINEALSNYVKYFFDNNDGIEEILTSNLSMICFSLKLKEQVVKEQLRNMPPKVLRKYEISAAETPLGFDMTLAKRIQGDMKSN